MPPGQTLTGSPLRVLIKADNFMLKLRELGEVGDEALLHELNDAAQSARGKGTGHRS